MHAYVQVQQYGTINWNGTRLGLDGMESSGFFLAFHQEAPDEQLYVFGSI